MAESSWQVSAAGVLIAGGTVCVAAYAQRPDTALAASFVGLIAFAAIALIAVPAHRRHKRYAAELAVLRAENRAQAELDREHRRLADLGILAAGIAHELGQPLSAARVDVEGLHLLRQLGREPDPAHTERVLSRVGSCLLSMTQIVEHLRELAIDQGADEAPPVDITAVVASVLADRKRWSSMSRVEIAYDPPLGPVPARGDPLGLRLILVNLLRNACEAVAGQDAARSLVRVVVGPGPQVAIHDSGPGIRPNELRRIFDPFISGKGRSRGIGLSLARASAARMGATIDVTSEIGVGSVFTVHLVPERS